MVTLYIPRVILGKFLVSWWRSSIKFLHISSSLYMLILVLGPGQKAFSKEPSKLWIWNFSAIKGIMTNVSWCWLSYTFSLLKFIMQCGIARTLQPFCSDVYLYMWPEIRSWISQVQTGNEVFVEFSLYALLNLTNWNSLVCIQLVFISLGK